MQATAKQVAFFDTLVEEKEFPEGTAPPEQLKSAFAALNKASATEWIEKAMQLPEKGVEHESVTPPSF